MMIIAIKVTHKNRVERLDIWKRVKCLDHQRGRSFFRDERKPGLPKFCKKVGQFFSRVNFQKVNFPETFLK